MYWSHGQQVSPGWLNSSDHPTSQVPGPGTSRRFPVSTRWLRLIQHHSAWFSMIHKNQFSWKVIEWIHASLLITEALWYLCGHVTIILIVSLSGWNMMNLDVWNLEALKPRGHSWLPWYSTRNVSWYAWLLDVPIILWTAMVCIYFHDRYWSCIKDVPRSRT